MKRLILASESPRRKELLSKLGLPFEVIRTKSDITKSHCEANGIPFVDIKLVKLDEV